ncbi:hypothetical protein L6452_01268 [Arctium lappa]|uniref:Uncharacterized protein n=2 Tax=Arctium lappa TaxID=4217 RepID=A0ACB9FH35_ARCLA|nr:hypothetical protein L6452_10587 [Arctium lappa]KAI3770146.1 hypothetical protein L6452_01268 [Arctium lappa]
MLPNFQMSSLTAITSLPHVFMARPLSFPFLLQSYRNSHNRIGEHPELRQRRKVNPWRLFQRSEAHQSQMMGVCFALQKKWVDVIGSQTYLMKGLDFNLGTERRSSRPVHT